MTKDKSIRLNGKTVRKHGFPKNNYLCMTPSKHVYSLKKSYQSMLEQKQGHNKNQIRMMNFHISESLDNIPI